MGRRKQVISLGGSQTDGDRVQTRGCPEDRWVITIFAGVGVYQFQVVFHRQMEGRICRLREAPAIISLQNTS
jgi:hypothetical protein